jgi:hypothetical protein
LGYSSQTLAAKTSIIMIKVFTALKIGEGGGGELVGSQNGKNLSKESGVLELLHSFQKPRLLN